jgi:outer membrane lipoprotein SlyB
MNIRILGVAAIATLAMAGCTTTRDYGYAGAPPVSSGAACYDCGTVTRIETVGGTRSGVTGAVLGGVVGAAAGRELADDESKGRRNTATAVGAVAGAAAGSAIQRNMSGGSYNVHVRMSDGRVVVVNQNDLGGIREGSYVRVYNGRAWIR